MTDNMKLQLAGFALCFLTVAAGTIFAGKSLLRFAMLPLIVMLGANCFRDKYTGPRPSVGSQELLRPVTKAEAAARIAEIKERQQKLAAYLARYHRFQLIWGGEYAIGESLVVVHASAVRFGLSLWAELLGDLLVLGLGSWILWRMFQRESKRKLESFGPLPS